MSRPAHLPASLVDLPLLATPRQAAHLLGLTDGQIRALIRDGRIAHIMIGKRVMVDKNDIKRFIRENKVQPCRDAIPALDCDSSKSGEFGMLLGQKKVAAASAALALQIAETLKSSSQTSFGHGSGPKARVIRLKSS